MEELLLETLVREKIEKEEMLNNLVEEINNFLKIYDRKRKIDTCVQNKKMCLFFIDLF